MANLTLCIQFEFLLVYFFSLGVNDCCLTKKYPELRQNLAAYIQSIGHTATRAVNLNPIYPVNAQMHCTMYDKLYYKLSAVTVDMPFESVLNGLNV
jgi:hypothetical protein